MIFKDYYKEDILLNRFHLYTTPFENCDINIKYKGNVTTIKRPQNSEDFISKMFFDIKDYDEIYVLNEDGKVSWQRNTNTLKFLGTKELIVIFNGITTLLNNNWEKAINNDSQPMGISLETINIKETECEILIQDRSYSIKTLDNRLQDILTVMQISLYNACMLNNLNFEKLRYYTGVFLLNCTKYISLYVDISIIDNEAFPYVNNTQDIFLFSIVNYCIYANNLGIK